MEKPQSNRAKSFNRFSGKQDHGDAAQRRGHAEQDDFVSPYWSQRWKERGAINADKTSLKEAVRDGVIDKSDDMSSYKPSEMGQEAKQREKLRKKLGQVGTDSEMDGSVVRYRYDPGNSTAQFDGISSGDIRVDEDEDEEQNDEDRLDYLYNRASAIVEELNELPRDAKGTRFTVNEMTQRELDSRIDELEGELEAVKEEIDDIEGNTSAPTIGAYEQKTHKELEASEARTAKQDASFSEDDFGDYSGDSHIRISNRPR